MQGEGCGVRMYCDKLSCGHTPTHHKLFLIAGAQVPSKTLQQSVVHNSDSSSDAFCEDVSVRDTPHVSHVRHDEHSE